MKKEPVLELSDRINEAINAYSRSKTGSEIFSEDLARKALSTVWFVRFNEVTAIGAIQSDL